MEPSHNAESDTKKADITHLFMTLTIFCWLCTPRYYSRLVPLPIPHTPTQALQQTGTQNRFDTHEGQETRLGWEI